MMHMQTHVADKSVTGANGLASGFWVADNPWSPE